MAEKTEQNKDHDVGHNARMIGAITLASRVLGLVREVKAADAFGAGSVWGAFTFAFSIPNLFRRLFGEGALSAAFIPLYAQSRKLTDPEHVEKSKEFASASVNLLVLILLTITVLGELLLGALLMVPMRADYVLGVKLTMVMLPYVMLVCGTAFLGAILQVHARFAATAATSLVLNACLIAAIFLSSRRFNLSTEAAQESAVYWLGVSVIVAGVIQVLMLVPSLHGVGFRFDPVASMRTPLVRKMLIMSVPVALGAGVLQISTLLDKSIAFFLAAGDGRQSFQMLGYDVVYPMAEGAAARLNWAQFMYQFPLGVFAIALATAIFPKLAGSVGANSSPGDEFKTVLRRGVESSLFIGLPATAGMVLLAQPAVRFLFERGQFTPNDTYWTALSTAIYSSAIWAFSLQQILNRAYYALHDTRSPLVWGVINLLINLVVELPLIWTGLAESGMAVGTLVAFSVQAVAMTWQLSRRVGGIGLGQIRSNVVKMLLATIAMAIACVAVRWACGQWLDLSGKSMQGLQVFAIMATGGVVYFGVCEMLGLKTIRTLIRRRTRSTA
jgi:putative peptidoglycan lipid II flippase